MSKVIRSSVMMLTSSALALMAAASGFGQTEDTEQGVLLRLDLLRTIHVTSDDDSLSEYNRRLDEVWSFFKDNKASVLPALAEQLKAEREKAAPSNFLLLDIGYFLLLEGGENRQYIDEAKEALFALDPQSEIIQANFKQLFEFTHRVAADQDPRTLSFVDKVFLYDPDCYVYLPQHAMRLDATLICVFLYGVYGKGSEVHLKTLLDDPVVTDRVIEILIWIGSLDSFDQVKRMMTAKRDHETFVRVLTYMMQVAGPAGKEMVLGIDPASLDSVSQENFAEVREAVRVETYDSMKSVFNVFPGDTVLSEEQLKMRLSAMHENYGQDDSTNPAALLNSGLPKKYLIEQLQTIRFRMFHRLSDEALSDVQVANALINTLLYRDY